MEQILKEILFELREVKIKVDSLEKDVKEVKTNVKELKETVNKLDKKEQEHFELLFEEYGRVYHELDSKISASK